jgi:hypothetical protein
MGEIPMVLQNFINYKEKGVLTWELTEGINPSTKG